MTISFRELQWEPLSFLTALLSPSMFPFLSPSAHAPKQYRRLQNLLSVSFYVQTEYDCSVPLYFYDRSDRHKLYRILLPDTFPYYASSKYVFKYCSFVKTFCFTSSAHAAFASAGRSLHVFPPPPPPSEPPPQLLRSTEGGFPRLGLLNFSGNLFFTSLLSRS